MQEDLVARLSDFGFTVNQAKVYLSIVQSGLTCVSKISESTQLHRQDIYKILLKLKKMGLITKTIDRPFMIKAIPVEKALSNIVSTEKKKAKERISRLEANLKELINAINKQQEVRTTQEQEEPRYMLLTTYAEIRNMTNYSFENARKEFDMVMNLELITRRAYRFRGRFKTLAENKVRIRLIIETLSSEDLVERTVEKIRPCEGNFAAKITKKRSSEPYQLIDKKELWVWTTTHGKTGSGLPCILWTNCKNMVQFYEENFEKTWNDPYAILIYPKTSSKEN